jgi:hypothetical protein
MLAGFCGHPSPRQTGRPVLQSRFTAPMRDSGIVEALREPGSESAAEAKPDAAYSNDAG